MRFSLSISIYSKLPSISSGPLRPNRISRIECVVQIIWTWFRHEPTSKLFTPSTSTLSSVVSSLQVHKALQNLKKFPDVIRWLSPMNPPFSMFCSKVTATIVLHDHFAKTIPYVSPEGRFTTAVEIKAGPSQKATSVPPNRTESSPYHIIFRYFSQMTDNLVHWSAHLPEEGRYGVTKVTCSQPLESSSFRKRFFLN